MFAHSTILNAVASVALFTGLAAATPVPGSEHALQDRASSGINIQAACNFFYGNGYTAQTTGGSCDDWACVSGSSSHGLNLNVWCADVYGLQAYASCSNGVYNWKCNY
jgi:hypothetical protein